MDVMAEADGDPAQARPRERAYERFKHQLLGGQIRPGDMVSLRELVRRLDMPLAAVREALNRLEGEGLVQVFPKRGIQVSPVDMVFMREAFQLRLILEREGLRALIETCAEATLAALEARFLGLRKAAAKGLDPSVSAEAVAANRALHDTIINALNSAMITDLYTRVQERLLLVRAATGLPPGGMVGSATDEHMAILGALRRRDRDAATRALETHLDAAMRRLMGIR
jgi:DNA-binding GntR family transcriptional regulator